MRPEPAALLAIDHEELVIRRGRRSGMYCAIAVHSTTLGPALGGCRMWHYPNPAEALRDALRLSRAMTLKTAAAGLALGGGKGVVCLPLDTPAPRAGALRRDALLDFADAVNALDGSYITAEDVGTSARDMVVVAQGTRFVTGLPSVHGGSGDPSSFTALGVEAAIRACCEARFGSRELDGRRVAVVGCGHVGEQLARRLAAAGAQLLLSDIEERKRGLAEELGAGWAPPGEALLAKVDVLAPCALGGVIDDTTVDALRCAVVCGAANNQLADDRLADRLAARGILFAPDFIANAGGIINVSMELGPDGYDADRAHARAAGIEDVMRRVLETAARRDATPLVTAIDLARRRLAVSGGQFNIFPTVPTADTPPRPDSDRTEIPQPVRRGETRDGDPADTPRIAARGIRGGRA